MSIFDVRIPGLKLTVVAADGQDVEPVTVDEFRIATAETYDVIVEPKDDRAYTIFAQSIDRSGYARGTLAPSAGMNAEIPPLDPRPLLTMSDMGMPHDMGGSHGASRSSQSSGTDHSAMQHGSLRARWTTLPWVTRYAQGASSASPLNHARSESGPTVDMRVDQTRRAWMIRESACETTDDECSLTLICTRSAGQSIDVSPGAKSSCI